MLTAAYTSMLIVRRQTALASITRYNLTFVVSQASLEVSRLYEAITRTLMPGIEVDPDDLDLRLAIVENRVQLMSSGEIEQFVASSAETTAIVSKLGRTVKQAREEMSTADPNRSRHLLALVTSLNLPLARLASAANTYSGDMEALDRQDLNRLQWINASMLLATTLCSLALVATVSWHNRLLTRAQGQVSRQNEVLQARDVELQLQNRRFDAALNNMSQALCMTDRAGRLVVSNNRFSRLFGLAHEDVLIGCDIRAVFRAMIERGKCTPTFVETLERLQTQLAAVENSGTFVVEDETGRALAVFQEKMADGGLVATFDDITERRRTEAQIHFMAHHDSLTQLPNRVLLRAKLSDALHHLSTGNETIALFCLDLDRFKQVNDVYGHPFGDKLLRAVGMRLDACTRHTDMIARLGGDEFAILQIGARQPDTAEATARRIIQEISAPYEIDGQQVDIGVTIGIALTSEPAIICDTLLKYADIALYRAKSEGRGRVCFYHSDMGDEVVERRALENDLRMALSRSELKVFYQPLYKLAVDRVCGFEALLRWDHPERGLISPTTFIPIAEETGLIIPIGEWVLAQACADAASWPSSFKVAVNLSPIQFRDPKLVEMVDRVIRMSNLAPNRLELEITESTLLQGNTNVLEMLNALLKVGVRLVLDDFGTGYSSLSYLHQFPFHKVKIDRSFISQMASRSSSQAIVQAIVSLATSLGMTTTAEGVETKVQLEQLREAGCTEIQGYLIDKARALHELRQWFAEELILLQ